MRLFSPPRLFEVLQQLLPAGRFWIGYSGGMDSTVLLHAVASLRTALPDVELGAVHINHGLHPDAARWSQHCTEQAARLGIPCHVVPVTVARVPGASLEAQARAARYAAFAALVGRGDCLLTAHHGDDQAETVLLQLLRGAGVHGLAAMPGKSNFGAGVHARPLLGFARSALAHYATDARLRWIDDPANDDPGFDRNYLRHRVMPALRDRWPAVADTLARSARHCAQAAVLIDATAALDLQQVQRDDGALDLAELRRLPFERQRALIRYWLRMRDLPLPPEARVDQILMQMHGAALDRQPRIAWTGAEVRRHRDRLYAMRPVVSQPQNGARELCWRPDVPLELPGSGMRLVAVPVTGAGLNAARCHGADITVRFRRGGERCRPADGMHTRSLKKLLQEAGVPVWERERLPLIYINGELAAVADRWICAPFAAAPGEPGLRVVIEHMDLRNNS